MGMNKRYIDINITNSALYSNQLSNLYYKCDILIFECDGSSHIYNLFKSGKSESEIINLLKTEKS